MSNTHDSNRFDWPDSLWKATAEPLPNIQCLQENIDTDVLIVGAGYTGYASHPPL